MFFNKVLVLEFNWNFLCNKKKTNQIFVNCCFGRENNISDRIVYTWVSDRRLENWDGVIRQIVRNDEAALLVDRFGGVHASQETQNIAVQPTSVLLHKLDEVPLRWFWEETHAGAEWIFFTAPSIVWWELAGWVSSLVLFVLDRWEIL